MDVKLKAVEPFTVAGLQVHTRNADELQPDTARIGPMWQQFFTEGAFDKIPARLSESFVYGVYSHSESDATGYFDEIGRASCRERVCQDVLISVVAVSLQKKNREEKEKKDKTDSKKGT